MKVRIFHDEFNDKNFWQMFDPNNARDYFMPMMDFSEFESSGGTITVEDTSIHDKYMRNIEIWAEHSDPRQITQLLLKLK